MQDCLGLCRVKGLWFWEVFGSATLRIRDSPDLQGQGLGIGSFIQLMFRTLPETKYATFEVMALSCVIACQGHERFWYQES